jgi:hypothetical protein
VNEEVLTHWGLSRQKKKKIGDPKILGAGLQNFSAQASWFLGFCTLDLVSNELKMMCTEAVVA